MLEKSIPQYRAIANPITTPGPSVLTGHCFYRSQIVGCLGKICQQEFDGGILSAYVHFRLKMVMRHRLSPENIRMQRVFRSKKCIFFSGFSSKKSPTLTRKSSVILWRDVFITRRLKNFNLRVMNDSIQWSFALGRRPNAPAGRFGEPERSERRSPSTGRKGERG